MSLTDRFYARILRDAVVEVVGKWRPLLRALLLPAVLMTASSYVTPLLMEWLHTGYGSIDGLQVLGYSQFVVWLLLYALFAMSCHRIILLGEESLPNRYGIYWSMRETRFLGWIVLVGAIYFLASVPFLIAAYLLGFYVQPDLGYWQIIGYVPMLLATYIDGRVSMVLPATAVGERSSIAESWRLTRGKGLHIAAALLIAALATSLVAMGTDTVLDDLPQVSKFVSNVLNFPMVALAVGIISVTYRELSEYE